MELRFVYPEVIFGKQVGAVGWIIAFFIIAVAVASLVGGAVLHPVLYGLFIAAMLVIPLWLGFSVINGIIDAVFGRRR